MWWKKHKTAITIDEASYLLRVIASCKTHEQRRAALRWATDICGKWIRHSRGAYSTELSSTLLLELIAITKLEYRYG